MKLLNIKRMLGLMLVSSLLMLLPACEKRLDIEPENLRLEQEQFKDENGLIEAVNGMWAKMANDVYPGKHVVMAEFLADHYVGTFLSGDFGEIWQRKTSIFGAYKNDFYTNPYNVVYRANKILQYLDRASAANKSWIEGEAYLLRGFSHWEIVKLWAHAPGFTTDNSHPGIAIRTVADATVTNRSTVKETYDQIIADLEKAESLLPEVAVNKYKPSKYAAKAALAKVYFWLNNFTKAYDYANQVIVSNKFALDATHSTRFSIGLSTEGVFQLKATDPNTGNRFGILRSEFFANAGSSPTMHLISSVYSAATTPEDARKAWYIKTTSERNGVTKYNPTNFDLPLIHLTDIRLIRAESAGKLNQNLNIAIQDLNAIIARAYPTAPAKLLPTSASAALIVSTARTERELEMIGEGDRLYQIKRIGAVDGLNVDRRGSAWNCNGLILQFPQSEMASNSNFQKNVEGGCN